MVLLSGWWGCNFFFVISCARKYLVQGSEYMSFESAAGKLCCFYRNEGTDPMNLHFRQLLVLLFFFFNVCAI